MPKSAALPSPFQPEVDGSAVRVNGLLLPLPDGWKPLHTQQADNYCDIPAKIVVVAESGIQPGNCDARPRVQIGHGGLMTGSMLRPDRTTHRWGGFREVVLPGGQPLWLDDNEVRNLTAAAKDSYFATTLEAPWAAAYVSVEMPTSMARPYMQDIRSEPVPPARLSIPDAAQSVHGTINGDTVSSSRQATIQQVIQQLRALDQTVDPAQPICPDDPPIAPTWTLPGHDMDQLIFATDDPFGNPVVQTVVALGTSTSCAFATSSDAGRVWLPEGFVAQLHELVQAGS
jgi:hypothetical protein